mmetsp:Transcript_36173/g.76024  ORF Transcript_36173/g.76024 Transcript_36173/m.76024 type:complete len:688 (-) Transcript_36173:33-2096(-)
MSAICAAKSALGPNGRGNPIVRVINANGTQSNNASRFDANHIRAASCQTTLPRLVSVCATGVAYLWELNLSIDLDNGEVLYFDIPPPLASFDGLVAAVSGKWGIPVKYPPTLSPTSISTLSSCSSWDQTDEVNAQFDVSFDPQRNLLCWVFSPDCIGSSLAPHAPREDRLNMNALLVCWALSNLPRPEWPPPILPPRCVVQLDRTADGKVSSEMALAGICGVLSKSHLATIYVTSATELMGSITDFEKQRDSVQLESNTMALVDLKTLNYGQCYTIAVSRLHPSLIAIGTQYGILFMELAKLDYAREHLFSMQEDSTAQNDKPSIVLSPSDSHSDNAEISKRQHMYATKIRELEFRNKELECQLDDLIEASAASLENERNELHARVKGLLEQHANFCDVKEMQLSAALSKAETLENELLLKNDSCQALESQIDMLRGDLEDSKKEMAQKLDTVEGTNQNMEKEVAAISALLSAAQEECDGLRRQLEETKSLDEDRRSERDSRLTQGDYSMVADTPETLRKELLSAKETEESLRNYIALLEEDKETMDKELEDARQQTEKYAEKCDELTTNLGSDVKEQKLAIDSLVGLLEHQRQDHERDTADQHDEIRFLKKELSELQLKIQTDLDGTSQSNDDTIAKLEAENASLRAEASTGNELCLAMKVELQNALNELAEYQLGHRGRPYENTK